MIPEEKTVLPKRKHPRLKDYNYSSEGVYFVTICTQNRRCLLSRIVGRGFTPAAVQLTSYGKVAEKQLFLLKERFPCLDIDAYVIMPNHIHIIFVLDDETAGVNPRPTIMDIVCAYKSLTTYECKKIKPIEKLFQTSFFEHIVRSYDDYEEIKAYVIDNPEKWLVDKLFSDETT